MNLNLRPIIEDIFYPYVGINSETGTKGENLAGSYFQRYFRSQPYFIAHPDYLGSYPVPEDPARRAVVWALVRGAGRRTVVMLHHLDVVSVEDYGDLGTLAFTPPELEAALRQRAGALAPEAQADLLSGEYIFGRGAADMKGGGAIQMALLSLLSREAALPGNLLLVAVPDEENLSAGMRSAVSLMTELRARFDLEYVLMINSEPHQRKEPAVGVLSGGSIGKLLPFVYVRGVLAHAGKSSEGVNPLAILGDIVRRLEMSLDLVEVQADAGEMSPPPTWLLARDNKKAYDVSMPLSAFGALSLQSLTNRPETTLQAILDTCAAAAAEMSAQINQAADQFHRITGRPARLRPWKPQTLPFDRFIEQARNNGGEAAYQAILAQTTAALRKGDLPLITAVWEMLDRLAQFGDVTQPLAVVGLLPPYYPSVTYYDRPAYRAFVEHLAGKLNRLAQDQWRQAYSLEAYFTGISDLSYSSLNSAQEVERTIARSMPFYGSYYQIPFEQISQISMPCINIGPWGKDFHKLTERVLKMDVFERTPQLALAAVREALEWGPIA